MGIKLQWSEVAGQCALSTALQDRSNEMTENVQLLSPTALWPWIINVTSTVFTFLPICCFKPDTKKLILKTVFSMPSITLCQTNTKMCVFNTMLTPCHAPAMPRPAPCPPATKKGGQKTRAHGTGSGAFRGEGRAQRKVCPHCQAPTSSAFYSLSFKCLLTAFRWIYKTHSFLFLRAIYARDGQIFIYNFHRYK